MKFTKKSEYALMALIDIALDGGDRVVRAQDIAERGKMSVNFLEQVLSALKNHGVVQARRGVGGGYVLNKPAESITLAEVIRLFDGALAPVGCVSEMAYTPCEHNESMCALKTAMAEVRSAIVGVLERLTLADLCRRAKTLQEMHKPVGAL